MKIELPVLNTLEKKTSKYRFFPWKWYVYQTVEVQSYILVEDDEIALIKECISELGVYKDLSTITLKFNNETYTIPLSYRKIKNKLKHNPAGFKLNNNND